MAENTPPSPLQVLARFNEALSQSGLNEHRAAREPVPLFRELLQEWYVSQDTGSADLCDDTVLPLLLARDGLVALQHSLRQVFDEAVQLSSAHGTLSIWTRRELDQSLQQLLGILEQADRQQNASAG